MTSNVGSHIIQENLTNLTDANREEVLERTRIQVFELLQKTMRPEFLNRIDELIMFTPLSEDEIRQIVKLQIISLEKMLDSGNIHIDITDKAVNWIAKMGYDPQFGARPVKRVIQKQLLNELSKQILAGKLVTEGTIYVDVKDEKLTFLNK